jgi:hypothetical protein
MTVAKQGNEAYKALGFGSVPTIEKLKNVAKKLGNRAKC